MNTTLLMIIKGLLTAAFVMAGTAKFIGVEMMVQAFDALGIGQWFRYATGVIEFGGAALLWIKGREAIGAGLLTCTMIGAVLSHVFILGPSAIPALILGVLAAYVLYAHRGQLSA